ncbi:MAG: hypothetical protein ACPGJS_17020 [Flammeovirgaceae bacterium]
MTKLKSHTKQLILVAIGFLILMNFPILGIFNKSALIAGIPVLYCYIFGIWAITILLIFVISNRKKES